MGFYGPEFVWILHADAGTIEDWNRIAEKEREENKTETCTKEQYQKAADGSFILEKKILYRSDENTTTASGLVRNILKYHNCQSGAIIGDGDRKRAPFLVLGLAPWYGTIFLFLEQIASSPAAHARTCCEDFLRMSRRGNGLRDSQNLCFWSTTQHVYVCWNLAQVFSS